jgi:hypothetical protein
VGQGADDRLALRRPRGDGRPFDTEVVTGEVDVVQLVAVDEASGGNVADLGVVLPAVPQAPDHLDVIGRLVEQLSDELLHCRVGALRGAEPRERAAAEESGLVLAGRYLHPQPGPPGTDVVEGRDRRLRGTWPASRSCRQMEKSWSYHTADPSGCG